MPQFQTFLAELRATVRTVVEIYKMHQKIVVIDDHTVLLGSLTCSLIGTLARSCS